MQMPGRTFNAGSSYRYGFNGQEKDNEIKGEGNSYTALFWEYDSRTGRRWNLDPKPDVSISQYSAFANNPIWNRDILGDTSTHINNSGKVIAIFLDGDNGVYKHGKNADGNNPTAYQISKRHQKSTTAGGEKVGETLTPLGFADFGRYEKTGEIVPGPSATIALGSTWATDRINQLLKDDPTLATYVYKAKTGGDYDFKTKVPGGEGQQFGSLLFGKYASARDLGNIGAGMVAQRSIMPNKFSDYGFGKYNESKNSILKTAWQIFGDMTDLFVPDGTGHSQQRALQSIHYSIFQGEDKLSKQGIEAGKTLMKTIKR